jgi:hypothetical protein
LVTEIRTIPALNIQNKENTSMENKDLSIPVPEGVENDGTDRRGFLAGVGALGVATVASMLSPQPANASSPTPKDEKVPLNLSSIAKLSVTREEVFDVPGGKEHFYEWQASDEKGVTSKFSVHVSRVDSESAYTISLDVTVLKFAPGTDLSGPPTATKQQRIVNFGIKGEVVGDVRNDRVITTTVHQDGSSSREERVVPVRLDLSEFTNQDFTTLVTSMGKKSLAQRR